MIQLGLFKALTRSRYLSGSVVTIVCLALIALTARYLRLNLSPSLPIGLYRISSDPKANLVEFCPSEPYGSLGLRRGYRSVGTCPDGGTPLMKPVVAKGGDYIELNSFGLTVNGNLLANTEPKTFDTNGRTMSAWQFGRYYVEPGSIWVASSYNARSFDSRYFGPVQVANVIHHLKPFLTE